MSKVQINLPASAKGEDVEVQGLGFFPNGKTSPVTTEQMATWCAVTNREWPASGTLQIPASATPVEDEDPTPADADKKEGKP